MKEFPAPKRSRWRRIAGRLLVGVPAALCVLVAGAVLALHHAPSGTRFANFVLARTPMVPGADARVASLRLTGTSGLEILGFRMARGDTVLAAADTVRITYRPWSLARGRIHLEQVLAASVQVSPAIGEGTPPEQSSGPPLSPADILSGKFYQGPGVRVEMLRLRDARYGTGLPDAGPEVTNVSLTLRNLELGDRFGVEVESLTARAVPGGTGEKSVDLALGGRLENGRLDLADLRLTGPASRISGHASLEDDEAVEVDLGLAPLDLSDFSWILPDSAYGSAVGAVSLRGPDLRRLSGTVQLAFERVGVGGIEAGPFRLDMTMADGRGEVDGSLETAGFTAAFQGWIRTVDPAPEYDLTLSLNGLPRDLPGIEAWVERGIDPEGRVRLTGRGLGPMTAEIRGEVSESGTHVDFLGRVQSDEDLEWALEEMNIANLDPARLAGDTTRSSFSMRLSARGRGTSPETRWVTAEWEVDPSYFGPLELSSGNGRLRLDGSRLGGRAAFEAPLGRIEVDTLMAELGGEGTFEIPVLAFRGVDLGKAAGNGALTSDLNGAVHLQGRGLGSSTGDGPPAGLLASTEVELDRSEIMGRRVESGEARVRLDRGKLSLSARLATDAGYLGLSASSVLDRDFQASLDEMEFRDFDAGAWGGPLSTRITGSMTGRAQKAESPVPGAPPWNGSLVLHLEPSRVGSLAVDGGDLEAHLTREEFRARGNVRVDSTETTFHTRGVPGEDGYQGDLGIDLPFEVLRIASRIDSLETAGGLRLEAQFAGSSLNDARISAGVRAQGRVGDLGVDTVLVLAGYDAGTVRIDSLLLRTNAADLDGRGSLVLRGAGSGSDADLNLNLRVKDLSPLRSLAGADTLALASGKIDLGIAGSGANRAFQVQGNLESLVYNSLRLREAELEAEGELTPGWRPRQSRATLSLGQIYTPSVKADRTVANLEYGDSLAFDVSLDVDSADRARMAGAVALDSAAVFVDLHRLDVVTRAKSWALVHPVSIGKTGARLAVDDLDLRSKDGHLRLNGVIDPRGTQDFSFSAENVGLEILSRWFGRSDVSGRLDSRVELTGPGSAPRAHGFLRVAAIEADKIVGSLHADLDWEGAEARIRSAFVSFDGDSLNVTGLFPVALTLPGADSTLARQVPSEERSIQIALLAREFPLASLKPVLPPLLVSEIEGVLDSDLHISGRGTSFVSRGSLALEQGTLGLNPLGVVYRDIEMRASMDENTLRLEKFEARSGKGRLRVAGDVRIGGIDDVAPSLSMDSERFLFVSNSEMTAQATMDLSLEGTLAAPTIRGSISLEGCKYTIPEEAMGNQASAVDLTPEDVRMMEETFGYQAERSSSPMAGAFDASDIDLHLSLGHDNWVRKRRSPRLAIQVTGEVDARKKPRGPLLLYGRVAPVPRRGYIEQFGRTFELAGGEVLLNGEPKDHTFNIEAVYDVRNPGDAGEAEVVVHLDVQGEMDDFDLTLTSEPPLSETEILTYISTGRTSIGGGGGAGSLAGDVGLSELTGGLQNEVQGRVGLDVLQVRYDAQQGATLVAGRYLNPKVYMGLRQPVQNRERSDSKSQNPYETVVELEYEAEPWLIWNLQGQTSLVRTFLRIRHAY